MSIDMGSSRSSAPGGGASLSRAGSTPYSVLRLAVVLLGHVVLTAARPAAHSLGLFTTFKNEEDEPKPANDPGLYVYLGTAIALVLLGGAFAGLTIALMGQDEIYLQVIATSGEGAEKRNASKVLKLLKKGKHWVLVTLLVANVITNETLPIVLDRSIGGGYAAAITSTVLVIIFGEIVPQSICVRFGLSIGAWMSHFVLALMWLFAPVSWPIAKLLDYLLGEDHGTTYKKAGLKTLVTLHKTIGGAPDERLNQDEVSIISGVLDLKAKSVGEIMTPMSDVFILSADAILDEEMIQLIMHEGYSRIPIHQPQNRFDFIGMLLVKMLITYDPEDAKRVCDFSLATLPETRPETSCLDIINFFQEGKSHMVLVSDFPGDTFGALGVVTLEDVIEELIGEEIIDESDVFIDVHRAIRRMQPAPIQRARVPQGEIVREPPKGGLDGEGHMEAGAIPEDPNEEAKLGSSLRDRKISFPDGTVGIRRTATVESSTSDFPPKTSDRRTPASVWLRRRSSQSDAQRVPLNSETFDQLRSLGPSNAAAHPKQTRISTVKIKPGTNASPSTNTQQTGLPRPHSSAETTYPDQSAPNGGIGHDLVHPGHSAKDGVRELQAGYGSFGASRVVLNRTHSSTGADFSTFKGTARGEELVITGGAGEGSTYANAPAQPSPMAPTEPNDLQRSASHSTLATLPSPTHSDETGSSGARQGSHHYSHSGQASKQRSTTRGTTRSGSITEQFVDSGGVKKLVLEMTSSATEDEDDTHATGGDSNFLNPNGNKSRGGSSQPSGRSSRNRSNVSLAQPSGDEDAKDEHGEEGKGEGGSKKRWRRRRKKKKSKKGGHDGPADGEGDGHGDGAGGSENTPLLGGA